MDFAYVIFIYEALLKHEVFNSLDMESTSERRTEQNGDLEKSFYMQVFKELRRL